MKKTLKSTALTTATKWNFATLTEDAKYTGVVVANIPVAVGKTIAPLRIKVLSTGALSMNVFYQDKESHQWKPGFAKLGGTFTKSAIDELIAFLQEAKKFAPDTIAPPETAATPSTTAKSKKKVESLDSVAVSNKMTAEEFAKQYEIINSMTIPQKIKDEMLLKVQSKYLESI